MNNWEKGIVVGIATSGSIRYVASSYDVSILHVEIPKVASLAIGQCIEFRAFRMPDHENEFQCRKVFEFRECDQFVDWERQNAKQSAVLICNVLGVTQKFHPRIGRTMRCFRTDFLEEVYDSHINFPRTQGFSDQQMLNMKIVAMRYFDNERNFAHWGVLNVKGDADKTKTGFIFTSGTQRNGKDELYVWVPGRPRDVMLPVELRKNIAREKFYGKWITFRMSQHSVFMDNDNDVRIVDDGYLPTRYYSGRWEVKVPVEFNGQNHDQRNKELYSEMCGIVIDCQDVLQKYQRLGRFADQAWVHNFFYDTSRNIKFILSDEQDEWERSRREIFERDYYQEEEEHERERELSPKRREIFEETYPESTNKERLKFLEKEYEHFLENDESVPKKLMEELEDLRRRNGSRKNEVKIEMKREDLMNYKELIVLFRGMLSSKRVSEEMQRYDADLLRENKQGFSMCKF